MRHGARANSGSSDVASVFYSLSGDPEDSPWESREAMGVGREESELDTSGLMTLKSSLTGRNCKGAYENAAISLKWPCLTAQPHPSLDLLWPSLTPAEAQPHLRAAIAVPSILANVSYSQ